MSYALRWGNCYAEIVRDGGGRPVALYPIDPRTVRLDRRGGALVYIQNPESGGERVLDAERVLHVRTMGDGYEGLSPVRLFRETIGLGLAAEKAGSGFFANGMRPGGVLEHPATLSDQAYTRLRHDVIHGDFALSSNGARKYSLSKLVVSHSAIFLKLVR
jgi:HK97 family phage portal protein